MNFTRNAKRKSLGGKLKRREEKRKGEKKTYKKKSQTIKTMAISTNLSVL